MLKPTISLIEYPGMPRSKSLRNLPISLAALLAAQPVTIPPSSLKFKPNLVKMETIDVIYSARASSDSRPKAEVNSKIAGSDKLSAQK